MLALAVLATQLLSPTASPTGGVPTEPIGWLVAFSLLVLVLFKLRGMYEPPFRLELTESVRLVVTGTALAATILMAARVVAANDPYVAAETVRHWLVAVVLLSLGRALVLGVEARARTTADAAMRTLIVGAGRVGRTAASRLLKDRTLGFRPVAFLDGNPLELDPTPPLPVYGWDDFERVLKEEQVEHAIIAFSEADHERLLSLTRQCWERGVSVSIVPRLFEIKGARVAIEHLGGLPLFQLDPSDPKGWQFRVKYALDRLVAALLLVLLLPIMLFAALAVWLSLGRPIFYRQLRVGRDGHAFNMLKFRTLSEADDPADECDADWAAYELGEQVVRHPVPLEGRLTRVGAFLRRSAIDELPQLWNVLRGDMSLVGPRPERATYVARFEEHVYRYGDRHRVKSGLTGWAQINGLRGTTSLRDRIEWDNHYIENWSPWLDLKILLKTARVLVMRVEGAAYVHDVGSGGSSELIAAGSAPLASDRSEHRAR